MFSDKTQNEIAQKLSALKPTLKIVESVFKDYVHQLYGEVESDTLIRLYCISFALIIPSNFVNRDIKTIMPLVIEYIDKDIDFQYRIKDTDKRHSKEEMHKWLYTYSRKEYTC